MSKMKDLDIEILNAARELVAEMPDRPLTSDEMVNVLHDAIAKGYKMASGQPSKQVSKALVVYHSTNVGGKSATWNNNADELEKLLNEGWVVSSITPMPGGGNGDGNMISHACLVVLHKSDPQVVEVPE